MLGAAQPCSRPSCKVSRALCWSRLETGPPAACYDPTRCKEGRGCLQRRSACHCPPTTAAARPAPPACRGHAPAAAAAPQRGKQRACNALLRLLTSALAVAWSLQVFPVACPALVNSSSSCQVSGKMVGRHRERCAALTHDASLRLTLPLLQVSFFGVALKGSKGSLVLEFCEGARVGHFACKWCCCRRSNRHARAEAWLAQTGLLFHLPELQFLLLSLLNRHVHGSLAEAGAVAALPAGRDLRSVLDLKAADGQRLFGW